LAPPLLGAIHPALGTADYFSPNNYFPLLLQNLNTCKCDDGYIFYDIASIPWEQTL
jgi:hypothetical protein